MEYTLNQKYELIKNAVLEEKGTNPILIAKKMMHEDFINMHGPEHHFLDGASLMVAIWNAGYSFDLNSSLDKLAERTIKMPGAMCGFWGICGSIASIGAVFSILDGTGPLSDDQNYSSHMKFTSRVINKMSDIGGPRCCKRNAFLSIYEGVKYANEKYGINLKIENITCEFSNRNAQCIKERCPFNKGI